MRAITISDFGAPEVLKLSDGLQRPDPAPGHALVRIRAAGVNFVDVYQRRGLYPVDLPFIPGLEAAGIVEAVGADVPDFKPGDRVAYTGHLGSYSEFTAIKASRLIRLPADLTFEEGAAFPLQGMAAHYLLHDFRKVKYGDTVLIHAAAGGVGLLLVQWAKRMGAQVIGTVSTEEKAAAAREAGADHTIVYTVQDFAAETRRITLGKGVQLILDGVGKYTFAGDLEAVAVRGHIVVYGAASGPADPVVPNALMPRSISISGGSSSNFIGTRRELLRRSREVLKGIQEGWLRLRIEHVLPLSDAAEAQRMLENRRTIGKIVLTV
jgi:NADPH2:quinone reductase